MKKVILRIGGMSCSACSVGLEKYINKQKGISACSVNLVMASATIEYDDNIINISDISRFIKEAGFECVGEYSKTSDKEEKNSKSVFLAFTFLAVLMMYVSMGHMISLPTPGFLNAHENPIPYSVISFVLCLPFIVYGFDIIKSGVKNAVHLTPNMDTLVSLGVFSALGYSIYSVVRVFMGDGSFAHELYFESVAIVIYFVKLGRFIDRTNKSKTKKAISSLVNITPSFAYIKKDDNIEKITIDEINEGDILICRPGEKIAVDGSITSGEAHIDESFITGESVPVGKKAGSAVLAGSVNTNGYIEYKAERVGKNSTVSEIVRMVIEASSTKPKISKAVDKVCLYFVPSVVLISVISFLIHIIIGLGISSAISSFITVLVVACPCALGLATPLAIVISEGALANEGILIKKSEILESASKINTVVFDKTGTLTYGKMKIAEEFIYTDRISIERIRSVVYSIEKKSSHPIARAFDGYAKTELPVSEFNVLEGSGLYAKCDGEECYLVNGAYLETLGIENEHKNDEKKLMKNGNSIVYFIFNSHIVALFGISDILRVGARDEIEHLKNMDVFPIMLTGDNEETANRIARSVGIDTVIAGVMPKKKGDVIKALKEKDTFCAMVGDGINDSVALSCADIGISMHGATDIAMDCSDVILTHSKIDGISKLIETSKSTLNIIKQNLFFAFVYNSLMIPVACGVLLPVGIVINPMIASFAMVISSLCVSLNSLRLTKRRK